MNIKTVYSVAIISSAFVWNLALANPEGGQVVAGAGTISQSSAQTNINQTSQSMVINWKGFDTKSNESVQFNQPNQNSVALNRITSGLPTSFAGSLNANGKVFIVNQAGMVFVGGSHVNTSGLVVSTSDLKDSDFMKGNYHFLMPTTNDNASIINYGTLKSNNSGVVALIAPNVINKQAGLIQADYGKVVLASGKTFVLDFNQDQLINFDATAAAKTGYVENAGVISAQNGKVFLTANALTQVLDSVVSSGDTTEAVSAVLPNKNGNVVLTGKVDAGQVNIVASNNIDVSAPITARQLGFSAIAKKGNININNRVDAGNSGVWLESANGSINENGAGGIIANNLTTHSATGTNLNSVDNNIYIFSACNNLAGDISLNNQNALSIEGILQNGGNLNLTTGDYISQDVSPDNRIKVTGTSSFTSRNSYISLNSGNQFIGTVSINSPKNVDVLNSSHNIILDNISVGGKLTIKNTAGSISQSANSLLKVEGDTTISTEDSAITLTNTGNQLKGVINLSNSEYSNQNISLNNILDTKVDAISAGGVLTLTTNGKLDVWTSLTSYATQAPNGHSIVINAGSISSRLYKKQGMVNPGENNSYLVYLANPDVITSSIVVGSLDMPNEIWEKPYASNGPETIDAGNHLVYSDKNPTKT